MAKNFAQVLADVMNLSTAEQSTLLQVLIGLGKADGSTPKELTTTVEPKAQPKAEKQSKPASSKKKQQYKMLPEGTDDVVISWDIKARSKSVGFGKLDRDVYQALKAQFPEGTEYDRATKRIVFASVKEAKEWCEAHKTVSAADRNKVREQWNANAK